ncbi:unnamed protein product [Fusarium graminearum]|uniref:Chromosome 2, complete genome n=1 Tax=Gibberella zeae (strain ATCC MYA-4620 / CBS 123657 / FGSC 9075 / NRRL 31084 / PH-1) TaxID=229533 RepID=A0A098DLI8_GIBZE|nr:unnamed protein product [Fusarium graminearum]
MPPRLGHKKSRRGCLMCKQRRVKTRSQGEITQQDDTLTSLAASPDPLPYLAKFVRGQEPIEQTTWLTDLELMHHHSTCTYLTLPRADELQHIWQIEMPKLALRHVYLLHQVLSVSAYHLAHLNPDRPGFPVCASQHQNEAIKGLRSAIESISQDNCVEIFLASSLLSIGAFAGFSTQSSGQQPSIDDLLDVFVLIRGMSDILNKYQTTLNQSRLGGLFVRGNPCESTPVLTAIIGQLRQITIPDSFGSAVASLCQDSIETAITWIEKSIRTTDNPDSRIALTFCLSVSADFLDLIKQRNPIALCVLAHYCVVLNQVGRSTWYMERWGRSVVLDIWKKMDPQWRSLLQWCMEAVECEGCVG